MTAEPYRIKLNDEQVEVPHNGIWSQQQIVLQCSGDSIKKATVRLNEIGSSSSSSSKHTATAGNTSTTETMFLNAAELVKIGPNAGARQRTHGDDEAVTSLMTSRQRTHGGDEAVTSLMTSRQRTHGGDEAVTSLMTSRHPVYSITTEALDNGKRIAALDADTDTPEMNLQPLESQPTEPSKASFNCPIKLPLLLEASSVARGCDDDDTMANALGHGDTGADCIPTQCNKGIEHGSYKTAQQLTDLGDVNIEVIVMTSWLLFLAYFFCTCNVKAKASCSYG